MIFAAASSKSSSGSYVFLIIIVGVLALMYFVMIRPQRNRQRQVAQTQNQIVPGQQVRTTAGIYGTLTSVDGNDVTLEVAPGVEISLLRRAIMEVISDGSQANFAEPSPDGTAGGADSEPTSGTESRDRP